MSQSWPPAAESLHRRLPSSSFPSALGQFSNELQDSSLYSYDLQLFKCLHSVDFVISILSIKKDCCYFILSPESVKNFCCYFWYCINCVSFISNLFIFQLLEISISIFILHIILFLSIWIHRNKNFSTSHIKNLVLRLPFSLTKCSIFVCVNF